MPRREFEMDAEQYARLIEGCKAIPAMLIGGVLPETSQVRANRAWAALGKEMGFDGKTVQPVRGRGPRFFTAEEVEREETVVPYHGWIEVEVRRPGAGDIPGPRVPIRFEPDAEIDEVLSRFEGAYRQVQGGGRPVEVEVRLLREGHGTDSSGTPGSGHAVEAKRVVRIEENDARSLLEPNAPPVNPELVTVKHAIREVLDEDDMVEMRARWERATEKLSAAKMRAALEVLER